MLTIGQREITGPGTSTHLATALAGDLHSKRVWPTPSGSAQRNGCPRLARPGGYPPGSEPRSRTCTDHPPPAAHKPQPNHHQEAVMNPIRHSHLIRRVTGPLAGLTALLPSITTGPAALAALLLPDPPGWLNRLAVPPNFPPAPAGWDKHPPLPGPAHVHAALAGGMAGWQITLIVGGATVLAAVLAVIATRMHAGRRRATATTAEARTTSGATP
jgi:hypothetical protein